MVTKDIDSFKRKEPTRKRKEVPVLEIDRPKAAERIPDFWIEDQASFAEVTAKPRQVAGLYFYYMLDCLVDLAFMVTKDFFSRPHIYTDVGGLEAILPLFNARYGSNEYLPNPAQRMAIFTPIFGGMMKGSGTGQTDFERVKKNLYLAARAFSERVYDTGEEMLREAVRSAHRPMKEYLDGLKGDSLRWSKDEALTTLMEEFTYPIFRSQEIAGIFGISVPPKETWPYEEDSNGDKLVEMIYKQLKGSDGVNAPLTREYISNLQRSALRGAEALATIIEYTEGSTTQDLDRLILKVYSWGSALQSIQRVS